MSYFYLYDHKRHKSNFCCYETKLFGSALTCYTINKKFTMKYIYKFSTSRDHLFKRSRSSWLLLALVCNSKHRHTLVKFSLQLYLPNSKEMIYNAGLCVCVCTGLDDFIRRKVSVKSAYCFDLWDDIFQPPLILMTGQCKSKRSEAQR